MWDFGLVSLPAFDVTNVIWQVWQGRSAKRRGHSGFWIAREAKHLGVLSVGTQAPDVYSGISSSCGTRVDPSRLFPACLDKVQHTSELHGASVSKWGRKSTSGEGPIGTSVLGGQPPSAHSPSTKGEAWERNGIWSRGFTQEEGAV